MFIFDETPKPRNSWLLNPDRLYLDAIKEPRIPNPEPRVFPTYHPFSDSLPGFRPDPLAGPIGPQIMNYLMPPPHKPIYPPGGRLQ